MPMRTRSPSPPGQECEASARCISIAAVTQELGDRKSTRLNSSHLVISYAVFCLKKKKSLSQRTVWIDYSPGYCLHVNTRNKPVWYVEWCWYVTPTRCVRESLFSTQYMGISRALF